MANINNIEGAKYWKKPKVDNFKRNAACPKNIRGNAVTTPASINQILSEVLFRTYSHIGYLQEQIGNTVQQEKLTVFLQTTPLTIQLSIVYEPMHKKQN